MVVTRGRIRLLKNALSYRTVLKLFTNNITIAANNTAADFTEMSGTGYSVVLLKPSDWTIAPVGNDVVAMNVSTTYNLAQKAGTAVYGYYLIDEFSGDLISASKFPSAIDISTGTADITLTPTIKD